MSGALDPELVRTSHSSFVISRSDGANASGQDLLSFILEKLHLNDDHLDMLLTEYYHNVYNRE